MQCKTILFFSLFVFSFAAFGQSDSVTRKKIVKGFYAGNTLLYTNYSKLNSVIGTLGYPIYNLSFAGVSYGITRRQLDRKSYLVTKVSYLFSSPLADNQFLTKNSKISMFEVSLMGNYDLINHPQWMLYPFFGEGIGYSTFTLYDNLVKQSFVASAANLSSPTSKTWSSAYLYFNAGLGVERKFKVWIYDFSVGLSSGYRLTLSKFSENNPSYSEDAPIGLSGVEWNFRIRFEIWRLPRIKSQKP